MENVFDDPDRLFVVLINNENQHSLWPADIDLPTSWKAMHGPAGRDECLAYIEANWTDMRPTSLIRAMDGPER